MCFVAEFLIKVLLIVANILFSLAGLAIAGLGIVTYIALNQIDELTPVNFSALTIGIIVLGLIVFVISYLACCGAVQQSRCMLISYAVSMAVLAGIKIWITVVIFNFLDTAQGTITGWFYNAFNNQQLRPTFNVMEDLFRCCGVTGAGSYTGEGLIPQSCCANPISGQCTAENAYGGCASIVTSWFETFGAWIGAVLIGIIIVEVLCMIFGLFLSNAIRNKRRKGNIY